MRVAFAIWNKRIAPVFDTAGEVLVVDVEKGGITGEFSLKISFSNVQEKTDQLKAIEVETLVCGAISRIAQAQVESRDIAVVSFVSGDIREVIQAWISNEIEQDVYAMPGCCRRRRAGRCGDQNLRTNTGGRGRRGRFGPRCRGV